MDLIDTSPPAESSMMLAKLLRQIHAQIWAAEEDEPSQHDIQMYKALRQVAAKVKYNIDLRKSVEATLSDEEWRREHFYAFS